MELYERIRHLCEFFNYSQSRIAKELDVSQSTFHQWLKVGSQKNLWEHLPKILELFPDVRQEWLYFEDDPMLKDGAKAPAGAGLRAVVPPIRAVAHTLMRTAEAKAAAENNDEHTPDTDVVEKLQLRIAELEQELTEERALNRKLTSRLLLSNDIDASTAAAAEAVGQK